MSIQQLTLYLSNKYQSQQFYFYSMYTQGHLNRKPQHQSIPNINTNCVNCKCDTFVFNPQNYPDVYWSSTYINQTYLIAHPLAIDRLFKLQSQIKKDKTKLNFNQMLDDRVNDQQQNHGVINNQQTINSDVNRPIKKKIRPSSNISRDCKTQLGQQAKKRKVNTETKKQLEVNKYIKKEHSGTKQKDDRLARNHDSHVHIQQLNDKIQVMQQQLHNIEARQSSLETIRQNRMKEFEQVSNQLLSRYNHESSQNQNIQNKGGIPLSHIPQNPQIIPPQQCTQNQAGSNKRQSLIKNGDEIKNIKRQLEAQSIHSRLIPEKQSDYQKGESELQIFSNPKISIQNQISEANNKDHNGGYYRIDKKKRETSSNNKFMKSQGFANNFSQKSSQKLSVKKTKYASMETRNALTARQTRSSILKRKPHSHKFSNPENEKSLLVDFPSLELAEKGIVVRHVMRNQALNEQRPRQRVEYTNKSKEMEPVSPKGNKIFQLEFVRAEPQQPTEDNQNMNLKTPEIKIQLIKIPSLPPSPSSRITYSELIELSKRICHIFGIKASKNDIYMKKYKNCVIFKTSDPNKTVVWHFEGKFYIGGWQQNYNGEGKKIGEGYQHFPNRYSYQGQFHKGKKNGQGTLITFLNNNRQNIYSGQWNMGQKHGIGKYYDAQQNSYYHGEFQNGKKQGKGILRMSSNVFYDGTFADSIRHGYGIQKFPNGDLYKGQYKKGRFHGRGKYYWVNGSFYDGSFVEGHREGSGRWRSSRKGGDIYIGQYRKDKKQGRGQYIWQDGCRYDGLFKNDLKNGCGRAEYADGRQIRGFWKMGKLMELDQIVTSKKNSYQSQRQQRSKRKPIFGQIFDSPYKALRHSQYLRKF